MDSIRRSLITLLAALSVIASSFRCRPCSCEIRDKGRAFCSGKGLSGLPSFIPAVARRMNVIGLQRNHLTTVNTTALLLQFPSLQVLDLSSQRSGACVSLLPPPPTTLTVRGKGESLLLKLHE